MLGDVPGEFEVLLLVLSHRHQIGVVEQDVGRHQHRVVEQPHRDVVALLEGLFLELDHALEPVKRRDAVEQPAEFAMGGHLALHEHRGLGGVNAAGQIKGCRAAGVGCQSGGIVGHRDRVQIDDAKKSVVALLQAHPVADRPQPVAQV